MPSTLARLFDRLAWRPRSPARRWPVLQVEVTSRCLLRCSFCPNKMLGGRWQHADLPWEVYRDHLGPHLSRFELIYLQGWGEPLLHRDLWRMVRLAKEAGCRVGFTSCGELFTDENIGRVLDEGVDLLSVSFAGASAAVHEALRVGSNFERLVANVRRLTERRAAVPGSPLHVELHFLMMRSNIAELPAFVRLAASLAADEAVATNLTYAFTPELDALRVFGPAPDPAHLALVTEAEHQAAGARARAGLRPAPTSPVPTDPPLGFRFRAYPLVTEDAVLECDARPTETAFVTCRGQLAPCVYLGMPVDAAVPRTFLGENRPMAPQAFGNVCEGLPGVLESPARRAFCDAFQQRKSSARTALLFAATQSSAAQTTDAGTGLRSAPAPEPPEPCRHCYKMLGV